MLPEKGRALIPILYQMAKFSIQYCPKDVFKDKKPRMIEDVLDISLYND